MAQDWFSRLTGFAEADYDTTRRQLEVDGERLRSRVNGREFGIGSFELVSLGALRERAAAAGALPGRLSVGTVVDDVKKLHQAPEYANALFQVASQFNMLEMVDSYVTPEHGVSRYQHDPTQGPGCAIAAGAATIYRNYFVPVGGALGQRADRQLDGLADVGRLLSAALGKPATDLWTMRNGYVLCKAAMLAEINAHLIALDEAGRDRLRAALAIGLHHNVEVTLAKSQPRPRVTQAFCSALPVSYNQPIPQAAWTPFATLVLEATYEATLLAAVLNARRGGSNVALLTSVGGGAFGNHPDWVTGAMRRALGSVRDTGLDVRLVSYGTVAPEHAALAREFRTSAAKSGPAAIPPSPQP